MHIILTTEPFDGALHRGAIYPMSKKPKTPPAFRKYLSRLWASDQNTRNAVNTTVTKIKTIPATFKAPIYHSSRNLNFKCKWLHDYFFQYLAFLINPVPGPPTGRLLNLYRYFWLQNLQVKSHTSCLKHWFRVLKGTIIYIRDFTRCLLHTSIKRLH